MCDLQCNIQCDMCDPAPPAQVTAMGFNFLFNIFNGGRGLVSVKLPYFAVSVGSCLCESSHLLSHPACTGYVITYETMPVYWQWMNRISPTTWII